MALAWTYDTNLLGQVEFEIESTTNLADPDWELEGETTNLYWSAWETNQPEKFYRVGVQWLSP
jgi:hypothetical protein